MFGFAAHRHNPGGKLLAAGLRQFIYFPAGQGEFLTCPDLEQRPLFVTI
jgi:hypothetical protein